MMKKKLMVKAAAILCAVILCLPLNFCYGSADEVKSYNAEELKGIAGNVALKFVKNVKLQDDIEVKEAIPVYDETGKLTGCCVSFQKQDKDYGYAMVTVLEGDMFIEQFGVGKGNSSLYDNIVGDSPYCINANKEKVLYRNGSLSYYTVADYGKGESVAVDNYGNSWEAEQINTYRYVYDKFSETVVNSIPYYYTKADTELSIPGFRYDKTKIIEQTGKYACTVVALTSICHTKGLLKNNNIKDTFNALWDYTKTSETEESKLNTLDKTIYGGANVNEIIPGMSKYIALQGKGSTSFTYNNPTYSNMREILSKGLSSVYSYGVMVKDSKEGEKETGHTVSVLGCVSAKDNYNHVYEYINVANGWRDEDCYICINNLYKTYSYAHAFRIN